jgi:D-tyrosyl-tRNA(Tyr) deacylase
MNFVRACIQRVSEASVTVAGSVIGKIDRGLVVLLGVAHQDTEEDARYLADRVAGLRVFEDDEGKMNRSLQDIGGAVLAISQFTLYGDCRKGRRPSFTRAAPPELAETLYERFVAAVGVHRIRIETGQFRAHMNVALVNDGPVTLLLDSTKLF